MHEKVQAYFDMLGKLSDEELDRSAQRLALKEKRDAAQLVAHIAELEERPLPIDLAYRGTFEYCVKRLNLSEGSVWRTTQVAGVCRNYPQILEAMSQGRLHLTGASLIAPHLTAENVDRLIAEAQGKTKREVEQLLVALKPKEPYKPSVRKQPVREADLPAPATTAAEAAPAAVRRTNDVLAPATEDRYNVRFSAGTAFTEKLTRLAEVLGIESPQNHLEEVLSRALDIALEHKDPQRRLERRREREARKEAACPGREIVNIDSCRNDEDLETEVATSADATAPSRHVPVAVRERGLERAGYQCEYRGPDGTRCSSRTGLEVDHTLPFAVYGTHDERYLRVLCPVHNLHAAKEYFGTEFIERKIEAARREQPARCGAAAGS